MGDQWIGATVSIILFLFSVINGLAFLINKKDSEKTTELMKCTLLELNNLKKNNNSDHEELFTARREIEKQVVILEEKLKNK